MLPSSSLTDPDVRIGRVKEGKERGPANNGKRPLCTRAGIGAGVVQTKFAPFIPGTARSSVQDDPRALRLLRHLWKRPSDQMVSQPAREGLEEMARPARPPQQSAVAALSGHARAIPLARAPYRHS